jgi:hypothetical protein
MLADIVQAEVRIKICFDELLRELMLMLGLLKSFEFKLYTPAGPRY